MNIRPRFFVGDKHLSEWRDSLQFIASLPVAQKRRHTRSAAEHKFGTSDGSPLRSTLPPTRHPEVLPPPPAILLLAAHPRPPVPRPHAARAMTHSASYRCAILSQERQLRATERLPLSGHAADARVLETLGDIYFARLLGYRLDNLQRSILCYRRAIRRLCRQPDQATSSTHRDYSRLCVKLSRALRTAIDATASLGSSSTTASTMTPSASASSFSNLFSAPLHPHRRLSNNHARTFVSAFQPLSEQTVYWTMSPVENRHLAARLALDALHCVRVGDDEDMNGGKRHMTSLADDIGLMSIAWLTKGLIYETLYRGLKKTFAVKRSWNDAHMDKERQFKQQLCNKSFLLNQWIHALETGLSLSEHASSVMTPNCIPYAIQQNPRDLHVGMHRSSSLTTVHDQHDQPHTMSDPNAYPYDVATAKATASVPVTPTAKRAVPGVTHDEVDDKPASKSISKTAYPPIYGRHAKVNGNSDDSVGATVKPKCKQKDAVDCLPTSPIEISDDSSSSSSSSSSTTSSPSFVAAALIPPSSTSSPSCYIPIRLSSSCPSSPMPSPRTTLPRKPSVIHLDPDIDLRLRSAVSLTRALCAAQNMRRARTIFLTLEPLLDVLDVMDSMSSAIHACMSLSTLSDVDAVPRLCVVDVGAAARRIRRDIKALYEMIRNVDPVGINRDVNSLALKRHTAAVIQSKVDDEDDISKSSIMAEAWKQGHGWKNQNGRTQQGMAKKHSAVNTNAHKLCVVS